MEKEGASTIAQACFAQHREVEKLAAPPDGFLPSFLAKNSRQHFGVGPGLLHGASCGKRGAPPKLAALAGRIVVLDDEPLHRDGGYAGGVGRKVAGIAEGNGLVRKPSPLGIEAARP